MCNGLLSGLNAVLCVSLLSCQFETEIGRSVECSIHGSGEWVLVVVA